MPKLRKLRSDSRPGKLQPAQRKLLHEWFVEGVSYQEISRRLKERFGVRIQRGSLSLYHASWGRTQIAVEAARPDAYRMPTGPLLSEGKEEKTIVVPPGWEVTIHPGPPLCIVLRASGKKVRAPKSKV